LGFRIVLIDTLNGSFNVVARITSSPLSLKGFDLESLLTSNRERLETLNITLTLYSLYRSTFEGIDSFKESK
jgi:hypothetical protein